jgi:hypothetical protein
MSARGEEIMRGLELFDALIDYRTRQADDAGDARDAIMQSVRAAVEALVADNTKLREAMDFAAGAIEDAIYLDDGLDGGAGEAVLLIMREVCPNIPARPHTYLDQIVDRAVAKRTEALVAEAEQARAEVATALHAAYETALRDTATFLRGGMVGLTYTGDDGAPVPCEEVTEIVFRSIKALADRVTADAGKLATAYVDGLAALEQTP